VASPIEAPGFDSATHPSIARVNDCWLEGSHHTQDDRDYAEQIVVCVPHIPYLVRASRQLTGRMVRYLMDQGVRQFLDLGSGIPTGRHVHEIAQAEDPASRVVYVDLDPNVAADGRSIVCDNDRVAYLEADIRNTGEVLGSPEFGRLVDLREPVGVLAIETLLYLTDADRPGELMASYLDEMAPGSHLGMSHCGEDEQLRAGLEMFARMFGQPPSVALRERDEFASLFGKLMPVDPGVVQVTLWNPLTEDEVGRNPELAHMYAGMGRKG
jgi:hypothetical protein